MKYPHLASRLYNTPLLLEKRQAEVIERVLRTHDAGLADSLDLAAGLRGANGAAPPGARVPARASAAPLTRRADKPYDMTDTGIAVIPIVGELVQRTGGMQPFSGMIPYAYIGKKLQAAVDDPEVRGILLEIDSPGGEVNGCFELAQQLLDAREKKRVWAVANEVAYSAAYALAGAASRLYVPQTGGVGSIGVIMLHLDQSKRDQAQGLAYTYIIAGARKKDFNPHEPLSSEAQAIGQAEVDRIYEIFVDHVARARGLSPEAVRATEAGVMNPEAALAGGYIDGVKTLAETLAALEREAQSPMLNGAVRRASTTGGAAPVGAKTSGDAALVAKRAEAAEAEKAYRLDPERRAKARARGLKLAAEIGLQGGAAEEYAEDYVKGYVLGLFRERERLKGILTSAAAKGRKTLANYLAFDTEAPVVDAIALLEKAPIERRGENVSFFGGVDGDGSQAEGGGATRVDAKEIFNSRRGSGGH